MTNKGKKQEKKTQLPFVSVCTPTFNRRPFVQNMFKCFLNQTYPKHRIEWIIVDDGTDKIRDLIESSNIPQIRYFEINEKMTLGAKRNYMHRYVRGDIVVYMDDDDYYPPERIEDAVDKLQANPNALCAGSSEIYIYFKHIQKMYKCGPYNANHATAGTFAFRKELLKITKYNETAAVAEEREFLKDYTIPFVQLDPMKAILVFSHIHNTFDKRKMLDNQHPDFFRECDKTVEAFIRNKSEKDIYNFFMKDIDELLANYEPGEPKMKPDVLKQIKEIEEQRDKMIKEEMEKQKANGQIMLQQPGKPPIALSNQEVVSMIQQQQQQLQALAQKAEQGDKTIQLLQTQLIEKTKQIRELSKKGSSNSETIKEQDTQSETVSIADSSKYEGMVIILQKQLIEKTKQFRELSAEKDKLLTTIKELESRPQNPIVMDTDTSDLQNMVTILQKQLIEKTKTIRELNSDKEGLNKELSIMKETANETKTETVNPQSQELLVSLQKQLIDKVKIIRELNEEKERLLSDKKNNESDNGSLNTELQNTVFILQKQLIEKSKQIRELSMEKDKALVSSTEAIDSDSQNTINILRNQLIEKNKAIRELLSEKENCVESKEYNNDNSSQSQEIIVTLQKQLVEKSKSLRELMDERDSLIQYKDEVEKNTVIKENMQSYINTLQEQLKDKSKIIYQLTDAKDEATKLKGKISELENITNVLKCQLTDKNKEILQLRQQSDMSSRSNSSEVLDDYKKGGVKKDGLPSFVRIPIETDSAYEEDKTKSAPKGKSEPEVQFFIDENS